ncbi:MAG: YlbG family protein [Tetragenococcus sp.]|nr:YlbG family protein [Tetragenococcus sp.]
MLDNEEDTFKIQKRRGLIVWVYSTKQIKNLRRYGFVHYVSSKMKYAVLYVNEEDTEKSIEKLNRLHFVRDVDISHRPEIDMNFGDKIGTEAAFQVQENSGEEE